MKLRWRIILALTFAALLPLIPMWISVTSTLRTGIRALTPETTMAALDGGIRIARSQYQTLVQQQYSTLRQQVHFFDVEAPEEFMPPAITRDNTLTLYQSDGSRWKVLRGGQWVETLGPPDPARDSFTALPELIRAEVEKEGYKLVLVKELDDEFRADAERLRATLADWTQLAPEREPLINSLVYTFILTYLLFVALSFILGLLMARRATRRIEQLTETAVQVSEGNEEVRTVVKGNDEIGQLAAGFNQMLDRLQRSRKTAADMEKKAAWRGLARVLAHEIKNPLTPIQLSVQQLSDSYQGDDEQFASTLATTREIVDEEVESLRKLVREFSSFARAPRIDPAEEDPADLLADLQSLYGSKLAAVSELPESTYCFDREKIKRALINLLDNAFAASGKEATVELRALDEEECLVFEVEDNGPGVPDAQCEKIFEPDFTTKRSGMGIGLPVVRTTATQHGGDVICLRGSKLGGALFRLHIQRCSVAPSDDE